MNYQRCGGGSIASFLWKNHIKVKWPFVLAACADGHGRGRRHVTTRARSLLVYSTRVSFAPCIHFQFIVFTNPSIFHEQNLKSLVIGCAALFENRVRISKSDERRDTLRNSLHGWRIKHLRRFPRYHVSANGTNRKILLADEDAPVFGQFYEEHLRRAQSTLRLTSSDWRALQLFVWNSTHASLSIPMY